MFSWRAPLNLLFPWYRPLSRIRGKIDHGARESAVASTATASARRRVLLVEDIDDVRAAIQDQLETAGLDVITAIDATSALAIIGTQPFDLLLTDLGLPGSIDGDELADIAAERIPGLKIITMTGYNKDRVTGGTVEKGPNRAHLRKPFKRAEFTKALNDLFS